jgi:signal transduction histidine kinase/HPt (histidine-containing phosphotransfer) domain-containing protein
MLHRIMRPAERAAASVIGHPAEGVDQARRHAVVALGAAGILPPLALILRPGDLGHVGAVPTSVALTALLVLAPALVGLVSALLGLDRVRQGCRVRGDHEHEQAALRVFVGALAFGYAVAIATAAPSDGSAAALIVAALGLGLAWGFLLPAIVNPTPSPVRQYIALIVDAALISAFLHFGAELTAPWVLLYLLATFRAGFRSGVLPLVVSAIANLAGFATVVAITPYWEHQPLFAGGLVAALAALPAYIGSVVHEVTEARAAASAAQAARTRFLMVISQALRAPLDRIVGRSGQWVEASSMVTSARALLSQVNSVLDFSAIEAGTFVPTTEAFDLHRLVNDTLAERRAEAARKGLLLRSHIDPALPYRLRGWPRQLAQIIDYIVARAIEVSAQGIVRVVIDAAGSNAGRARLRLVVRDADGTIASTEAGAFSDPFAVRHDMPATERASLAAQGAFGLAVVRRLVELMGGEIGIGGAAESGGAFKIVVPVEIDDTAPEAALDLERCLVLIASEDSHFASDLAEPLNAWHGDPRWIDSLDGTLDFVDQRDGGACSVLIVDGRQRKLAALTFAHRAVTGGGGPSFVLFVAEATQIAGLVELADDELDAVLAAPVDNRLLANALRALPLWHGPPPRPVLVPASREPVPEPPPLFDPIAAAIPVAAMRAPPAEEASAAPQITPIASHPRFAAEAAIVDARAVLALRGLGGDDAFLAELFDSFRSDTREIMERLARAAAAADGVGFTRCLHRLRSCAANLGGTRLCEVLLSLRDVDAGELREQGGLLVQRLGDEVARLDAALAEFLPPGGERALG